jgi:hypothetical protein
MTHPHRVAGLVISFVSGIIGCSVLWSISGKSVDGVPSKDNGAHHAFNYVVTSVMVAWLFNVVVVLTENKYLRWCHL